MVTQGHSVHLVVLIHGLWGEPSHLFAAKEELETAWADKRGVAERETEVSGPEEDPTIVTDIRSDASKGRSQRSSSSSGSGTESLGEDDELVVMIAGGMTSKLTYDGIDVCASRVAWEIDQTVSQLEQAGKAVIRFSLTGYSLGGLVARYLVGLLDSRSPSFFDKHAPVTFSTIATPHLGVPRYNTFLSTVLVWLGSKLLSRSGEQLYVADTYSDEDRRPLLEIMSDPNLAFVHGLSRFSKLHIFANGVNDHTVPYPSSAIETTDHFADWQARGLRVESDEGDIITSWLVPPPEEVEPPKKKGWGISMGTLPPFLRYRFPFNYLIMLLFPVMLPAVMVFLISRLALDTRRSKNRLRTLAQAPITPDTVSSTSPTSSIGSASGTSVHSLRDMIRRVERTFEADMIDTVESNSAVAPQTRDGVKSKLKLNDSQLRMALWLNRLPLEKFVSWYPDEGNAHALAIVRDPKNFPAHNRGRGLLRRWAQGILR